MQDHVEGYLELSAKTKIYFATAIALWDADFYVKVDDDVHVNIGNRMQHMSNFSFTGLFKFILNWKNRTQFSIVFYANATF